MPLRLQVVANRVVELLVNPAATWKKIDQEADDPRQLVLRYVALLAAAAAACLFVGNWLFGQGFWFSLVYALLLGLVFTGLAHLQGVLITALAPYFGARRDPEQALRLAAYCATPICVAGLTTLAPSLAPLAVLGGFLYSGFLFHRGAGIMLGTPEPQLLRFTLVATGSWLVVLVVAALVVSRVTALMFAPLVVLQRLTEPPPQLPWSS